MAKDEENTGAEPELEELEPDAGESPYAELEAKQAERLAEQASAQAANPDDPYGHLAPADAGESES